MEPIVSPWFIYLLSLVDSIIGISIGYLIAIGLGLFAWLVVVGCIAADGDDEDKENLDRFNKKLRIKVWFVGWFMALFVALFVPNKRTMIEMYVADKITYDSADKILDKGKAVKDELKKDIIDMIQSFDKKKKE